MQILSEYEYPPHEIIEAAELVGNWFAERNINDWVLGPCASRNDLYDYKVLLHQVIEMIARSLHYFENVDRKINSGISPNIETGIADNGWEERYFNDNIFHAKVQMMAIKLMEIIQDR